MLSWRRSYDYRDIGSRAIWQTAYMPHQLANWLNARYFFGIPCYCSRVFLSYLAAKDRTVLAADRLIWRSQNEWGRPSRKPRTLLLDRKHVQTRFAQTHLINSFPLNPHSCYSLGDVEEVSLNSKRGGVLDDNCTLNIYRASNVSLLNQLWKLSVPAKTWSNTLDKIRASIAGLWEPCAASARGRSYRYGKTLDRGACYEMRRWFWSEYIRVVILQANGTEIPDHQNEVNYSGHCIFYTSKHARLCRPGRCALCPLTSSSGSHAP